MLIRLTKHQLEYPATPRTLTESTMTQLEGKIIIATGGTQGVGESVALHAAKAGAAGVVVCGRQEDKGVAVAAKLNELGAAGVYVPADLSIVDDCKRVVAECDARFGRVDGLVNAAADTNRGTLTDTTVEFWDYQFAVNVRAPFLLSSECVKIMRREKIAGSIVNILSVAAYCGMDILCSYSATKGALSTFTKNIANSLRNERIRVNGINLGWTDTPGEEVVQRKQGSPPDWLAQAEAKSPFGRLLKSDDVAKLCIYLLSEESGILTGSNIDYSQRVMGVFPPEPDPA
ncbi:MAG: SDR family oxidoreductase [Pirellulaceae bacterium]|jgi:NAD(P)-dependent dehydrogenase (short-subunit alcohol dehydrogenase family)|nr:SDR family oxidoreductase [Pirellulaceae bacterium]